MTVKSMARYSFRFTWVHFLAWRKKLSNLTMVGVSQCVIVVLFHVCVYIDIQVLLMTDILVFLQEKDQRYIFPCLVRKSTLKLILLTHYLLCWWGKRQLFMFFSVCVLFFSNSLLFGCTGQTSGSIPSEPYSEGYSQSGARHVPHQRLLPSWDVRVPCCLQRGQEYLDTSYPAHRQQVGKCTNISHTV